MPEKEWEYLEMECPEGFGDATITFTIHLHSSSRRGANIIDAKKIAQVECDLHDDLLKQGENCGKTCETTIAYKQFVQRITAV